MLRVLNSLVAIQTEITVGTTKYITNLLNYCALNPDVVTEYRRSDIILHLYSDASYLSEPEAHSRAGGYFFLGPLPRKTSLDNDSIKWIHTQDNFGKFSAECLPDIHGAHPRPIIQATSQRRSTGGVI